MLYVKVALYNSENKTVFCLITKKLISKFRMHPFFKQKEVVYTTDRSNLTHLPFFTI